jgi:hypothetical protein
VTVIARGVEPELAILSWNCASISRQEMDEEECKIMTKQVPESYSAINRDISQMHLLYVYSYNI